MIFDESFSWFKSIYIGAVVLIMVSSIIAYFCSCCRKNSSSDDLRGISGVVKTITSQDSDQVNDTKTSPTHTSSEEHVSFSTQSSAKNSLKKKNVVGILTNQNASVTRSLPEIPVGITVATSDPSTRNSEINGFVSYVPNSDNNSDLYATLDEHKYGSAGGATKSTTNQNRIPFDPSVPGPSGTRTYEQIDEDPLYNKVKREHPYAQVENDTDSSTYGPVSNGRNMIDLDEIDAPSNLIPAASAITGGIAASIELPYMTPPIHTDHFSGDSQDSAKGYTSISVREPLERIRQNISTIEPPGSHYTVLSDDSEDLYAAIQENYTSESETYAQIQPREMENNLVNNVDSIDGPSTSQRFSSAMSNVHSRQTSTSSVASSITAGSNRHNSPKEKRQVNSPLPKPPDFSPDDMYAKVYKKHGCHEQDWCGRDGSRESIYPGDCGVPGSLSSLNVPTHNVSTVTRDNINSEIKETGNGDNDDDEKSSFGYETLRNRNYDEEDNNSNVGYETLKGNQNGNFAGYESLKETDSLTPGYERIRGPNSGYENLSRAGSNGREDVDEDESDPNYEQLRPRMERDNITSTEHCYATISKGDKNAVNGENSSEPDYASLSKDVAQEVNHVSFEDDPFYEKISRTGCTSYYCKSDDSNTSAENERPNINNDTNNNSNVDQNIHSCSLNEKPSDETKSKKKLNLNELYSKVNKHGKGNNMNMKPTRPRVDPNALGEVDPSEYPEPKESTHRIRGRSDIMELIFGDENQELIMVKLFYFFFYSAFGSLFPLMGVYFKQMGMTPSQCGLLIGCRPFVEFLAAPFWGSYADKSKQGKTLLLISLSCWILFTMPIGYLQPYPTKCLNRQNGSNYILEYPHSSRPSWANNKSIKAVQEETATVLIPNSDVGKSPLTVVDKANEKNGQTNLVSPLYTTVVYKVQDVQKSFFLMLLLIIIGEFFSAPAITLMDSAVITLLGDDADRYGHQRMFGSLGWGLSMFFLGIALDRSTAFTNHPCGKPGEREKNYMICFFAFSVLMGGALISATQINFKYDEEYEKEKKVIQKQQMSKDEDDDEALMEQEVARQLNLPSLATGSGASGGSRRTVPKISNSNEQPGPNVGKTVMFAQTTREMPEWVTVLKHYANLKCASFLFVAWLMGFGIGLIFTFLFWHLQEFGGSPTLFGFASIINHISEICAFFWSFKFIRNLGHVKVLCLGLIGNIIRFLYVSLLTNPWFVLPFELMQGITHAAVWAACCSYIAHNTPPELRNSAQGVLQGLHHGFGRGSGAIIGGLFVTYYGSTATFRGYGLVCAVVLGVFIFINFYRKDTGFVSDLPMSEDPHQVVEESVHLAPHGVPSNPIPRALSSNKLQDMSNDGSYYGTVVTSNNAYSNNLHPNGGGRGKNNPFLEDSDNSVQSNGNGAGLIDIRSITQNIENLTKYDENDVTNNRNTPNVITSIHIQQPEPNHKPYNW